MKTRDLEAQRERGLSSLFHRVSPGTWLAAFLFARVALMGTGCNTGPADGSNGGKCADGCDQHCYDGTVCDAKSDTCIDDQPTSGGGSTSTTYDATPTCTYDTTIACDAGETSAMCTNGKQPSANDSCALQLNEPRIASFTAAR